MVETFAEKHSNLTKYWSPNNLLKPNQVTPSSAKKILWVCLTETTHTWEKTPAEMSRFPHCPHCKIITMNGTIPGENDVNTLYPQLQKLYDTTKNKYPLSYYTPNSRAKVYWIGKPSPQSVLSQVTEHRRATELTNINGQLLSTTSETLINTHPEIAKLLSPKNNHKEKITHGSNRKLTWVCDNQHEWEETPKNVIKRNGSCPICKGKQVLTGYNDVSTLYPHLKPSPKNSIDLTTINPNSQKRIWWECEKGHEWETKVCNRTAGNNCPYCTNKKVLQGYNDLLTLNPNIQNVWHTDNSLKPEEIVSGSEQIVYLNCDTNKTHRITTRAYILKRNANKKLFICPTCPKSSGEAELQEYVKTLTTNIITNDRTVLNGKELDIYIPEKKIAIEYNGLYWHSEAAGKDKFYHYDKWLACKKAGIQLIQIWEDNWEQNQQLVKNMLAHKLNVTLLKKVYARNTEVVTLNKTETNMFLENHHIQGKVNGSIRLGLKQDKELLAVIVFKYEPGEPETLNLLRFATSQTVTGAFTKLVHATIKTYASISKIITFSDNMVSDGNLYNSNGFIEDKNLSPDYSYMVNGNRIHKFNYRLKRFKTDPSLKYIENESEKELARLNGLTRIWDAGKVRWVLKV